MPEIPRFVKETGWFALKVAAVIAVAALGLNILVKKGIIPV